MPQTLLKSPRMTNLLIHKPPKSHQATIMPLPVLYCRTDSSVYGKLADMTITVGKMFIVLFVHETCTSFSAFSDGMFGWLPLATKTLQAGTTMYIAERLCLACGCLSMNRRSLFCAVIVVLHSLRHPRSSYTILRQQPSQTGSIADTGLVSPITSRFSSVRTHVVAT